MGNSVEQWRAAIGCFRQPSCGRWQTEEVDGFGKTQGTDTAGKGWSSFRLGAIALFSVALLVILLSCDVESNPGPSLTGLLAGSDEGTSGYIGRGRGRGRGRARPVSSASGVDTPVVGNGPGYTVNHPSAGHGDVIPTSHVVGRGRGRGRGRAHRLSLLSAMAMNATRDRVVGTEANSTSIFPGSVDCDKIGGSSSVLPAHNTSKASVTMADSRGRGDVTFMSTVRNTSKVSESVAGSRGGDNVTSLLTAHDDMTGLGLDVHESGSDILNQIQKPVQQINEENSQMDQSESNIQTNQVDAFYYKSILMEVHHKII